MRSRQSPSVVLVQTHSCIDIATGKHGSCELGIWRPYLMSLFLITFWPSVGPQNIKCKSKSIRDLFFKEAASAYHGPLLPITTIGPLLCPTVAYLVNCFAKPRDAKLVPALVLEMSEGNLRRQKHIIQHLLKHNLLTNRLTAVLQLFDSDYH